MQGLGYRFDLGIAWAPVDINTGDAATGKRCSLKNAQGVTFFYVQGAAASGSDDLVLDVQQATAYTGGTSGDCDVVTEWYIKSEATLDNDESWTRQTQSAASEVTITGATWAAKELMVAIYVDAAQLSDGYSHVSINAACTTAASRLTACYYILHDLKVQRKPVNLGNLLNPGAANV